MNEANDLDNATAIDGAAAGAVQTAAIGPMSGVLFAKVARGAFLLMLAVMLVSWAMTIGNSRPADPQPQPPTGRMYS